MPSSAIIVPSYNRPDQLANCLEALVAQDAHDFEVVVVDDGSPTPLRGICYRFGDRVRYIRQSNSGPAAARNRGARSTSAAFIAFTDDDCRPRKGWLRALREAHGGNERTLVGGRVENGLPRDQYASASQALCDYLYDYFGAAAGNMPFFTSNNIAMSRVGFERLAGFEESFGRPAAEDRDFGFRWKEAGGTLVYAEQSVIDHYHAMTFRKYWRQHSNYGAGAYHLHQVMAARGAKLPKFEPFRFYAGLLAWPIKSDGMRRLNLSMLMALSQVAMVNGYFEARRAGGR